jgi:hypothetical protein
VTSIKFDLSLSKDETNLLKDIIESEQDDLDSSLSVYAKAAFEEYIRMFLGQKVFTRGSDMREYRLFLLIKTVFNRHIPDEQKICDLFQLTLTESRTLIRSVMSKYQYELKEAINNTLIDIIINAKPDDKEYLIDVKTENLVRELNKILGSISGDSQQINKKVGTITNYIVKPSAYVQLLLYPEFKEGIRAIFIDKLKNADMHSNKKGQIESYTIKTDNFNIIYQLNKMLDSNIPTIKPMKDIEHVFSIGTKTYEYLKKEFMID